MMKIVILRKTELKFEDGVGGWGELVGWEGFGKFLGNYLEVSRFPELWGMSGVFKMILCDDKIKF